MTKNRQQTIKSVLTRLVGFNTVSSNSNSALIDYVCAYLEHPNIRLQRITRTDENGEQKDNLIITLGALDRPSLLLSAHSDVVPVEGQNWRFDPFTLTEEDNLWYGRGTTDMKGFVAVCLTFIRSHADSPPPIPIQMVLSHDEEIGCKGVLSAVETIAAQDPLPALCIVGEPSDLTVVRQHKSNIVARAECRGTSGHSSNPDSGVNAIDYLVLLYQELIEQQQKYQAPNFVDPTFVPSYSSFHCGYFQGGVILNIIPEKAHFAFEIRGLPDHNLSELVAPIEAKSRQLNDEMAAKDANAGCSVSIDVSTPGLLTAEDDPMCRLCHDILGTEESASVSYATEAGHFSAIGIPTLVVGPSNIAQAHIANEYIDPYTLDSCYQFLDALVTRLGSYS